MERGLFTILACPQLLAQEFMTHVGQQTRMKTPSQLCSTRRALSTTHVQVMASTSWPLSADKLRFLTGSGLAQYQRCTRYVWHVITQGYPTSTFYTCPCHVYDITCETQWQVRRRTLPGPVAIGRQASAST